MYWSVGVHWPYTPSKVRSRTLTSGHILFPSLTGLPLVATHLLTFWRTILPQFLLKIGGGDTLPLAGEVRRRYRSGVSALMERCVGSIGVVRWL